MLHVTDSSGVTVHCLIINTTHTNNDFIQTHTHTEQIHYIGGQWLTPGEKHSLTSWITHTFLWHRRKDTLHLRICSSDRSTIVCPTHSLCLWSRRICRCVQCWWPVLSRDPGRPDATAPQRVQAPGYCPPSPFYGFYRPQTACWISDGHRSDNRRKQKETCGEQL